MFYKGYTPTLIELDEDTATIHGRVTLRRAMVTFEGSTVVEAIQAFHDSIDDYLRWCERDGIAPEPPEGSPSKQRELTPSAG